MVSALSLSISLFTTAALSAVSPQGIGSDLTIVTHNDLYGNKTTRDAAVVVDAESNYTIAESRCAALESSVWNPDSKSDISFLRFLDYSKGDKAGPYWIKSDGKKCNTISAKGNIKDSSCDRNLSVLCANTAADTAKEISVSSQDSTITGYRLKDVFRFLGIKYATIPARFEHAKYLPPAKNVNAFAYGDQCVSSECTVCSEDCLSLNIWTPYLPNGKVKSEKKKAVMLYIHGGSFLTGSNRDPTIDGTALASRGDVVSVSINYRLSTLGFLAVANSSVTGNFGLTDASTALDWVRTHIEDFGGDKDRITVFGQSAGAAAIRALLTSKVAQNKFANAIMMSTPQGGGAASYSEYLTVAQSSAKNSAIFTQVGCSNLSGDDLVACLRKIDAKVLVGYRDVDKSFSGAVAQFPVVDASFLTLKTLPLSQDAPKLPHHIMAGIVHDDGSPFTSYSPSTNTTETLLLNGFNASAIEASGLFPLPSNSNITAALFNLTSRIATDAYFRCAAHSTAYLAAQNSLFASFHAYEFDRAYQVPSWSPNGGACEAPKTASRPLGDVDLPYYRCHSGELLSVFGTEIPQGRLPRDQDDIPFSQYVLDSWTAFARRGDPVPEKRYLESRGFVNTTKAVREWKEVSKAGDKPVKVLDRINEMKAWREVEQCKVLGITKQYYEGK